VVYHAIVRDEPAGERPAGWEPFRPTRPWGYEGEVEAPLGAGLRLRAGASFQPFQFDGVGSVSPSRSPSYLTDGNATVRESRVALLGDGANISGFVELMGGETRGTVALLTPLDASMRLSTAALVRYLESRCGLRLPASGTDLILEYRRLRALDTEPETPVDTHEQVFELRLQQQLRGFTARADVRFLVALRLAQLEAEGIERFKHSGGDPLALDALNRRMSAGLSVVF
jgi:hypothetical protein